jgi:hypothetical protein
VLDELRPLRVLAPTRSREAAIFPPGPRIFQRAHVYARRGATRPPNPPFGAAFTYYLRDGGAAATVLIVKDAAGKAVRTLEVPASAGVRRVTWDLRGEPRVEKTSGAQTRQIPAPLVAPGRFTVTLARKAGEAVTPLAEQTFEVVVVPAAR